MRPSMTSRYREHVRYLLVSAMLLLGGCSDDGDKTPDASTVDATQVCTGSTVDYLKACTDNTMCGSTCECHSFGHSMVCTKTCTVDSECPAPSGGCTTGFCRP